MGTPNERYSARVKRLDERILEESLRRSGRRGIPSCPDLIITGGVAPGYQWRCEKYKHLPGIRTISLQRYEAYSDPSKSQFIWSGTETEDQDNAFALNRVYEILSDEGFNSKTESNNSSVLRDVEYSTSKPKTSKVHQLLHQKFISQIQTVAHKSSVNIHFASHQARKRTTYQKRNQYINAASNEILKVLKTKNKLPALRPKYFEQKEVLQKNDQRVT